MGFDVNFRKVVMSSAFSMLAAPLAAQELPQIVAVNYPLAYFAERLAGDAAEVVYPVPEGSDPSFWRPGIADISMMQSADLILLNGAGFASWVSRASLPRARQADTSAAFSDRYIATEAITHSHGPEGEHSHTGTASYTWLDFEQAALQAEAVASALTGRLELDPDGVAERLASLQADLVALHDAALGLEGMNGNVTLITSHPRYQYFGRTYGFDLASLEWPAGEMPDKAQWQDLADVQQQVPGAVFLWEMAPPVAAWDRMAEQGLPQVVLDPMARPIPGEDFVSTMTRAISELDVALRAPRKMS